MCDFRSASLMLTNLEISGCDLVEDDTSSGIMQTDEGPDSQTNAGNVISLQHVGFTENNGSLLTVREPSCYEVVMFDVRIQLNRHSTRSQLSESNDLTNVTLMSNGISSEDSNTEPMFYLPPSSSTRIQRLTADGNTGTLIHVNRSEIDVRDSSFSGNSANRSSIIFAEASNVTVSASTFFPCSQHSRVITKQFLHRCHPCVADEQVEIFWL